VPLWILAGRWFGENLEEALKFAERAQLLLFAVIVILIGTYVWYRRAKKFRRARKIGEFMRAELAGPKPPDLPHI
jgi:membrane protein DedA with SNARE-associated domain